VFGQLAAVILSTLETRARSAPRIYRAFADDLIAGAVAEIRAAVERELKGLAP